MKIIFGQAKPLIENDPMNDHYHISKKVVANTVANTKIKAVTPNARSANSLLSIDNSQYFL